MIPDIARTHWQVDIRKFVVKASHLDDLVRLGTLTRQAATFLDAAVVSGLNILVAGATRAGNPATTQCTACVGLGGAMDHVPLDCKPWVRTDKE